MSVQKIAEVWGYVAAGLAVYAVAWAVVKASIVRVIGKDLPRNALTITLDVLAELANNLPGALNRAKGGGMFDAPSRDTVAPPPPSDPQRGAVRVGALLVIAGAVVVASVVGALLTGCPAPRLPAVEGCTVRASRCHNDRPQVCSSTGRWHDVGDLACAASGAVCVEGDAGVAHCAVATDGGAHD